MSTMRPIHFAAIAASLTFPTLAARSLAAQDAPPTIVGTWTLNEEKTEAPRDRTLQDPEGTGSTVRTGLGGRGGRGGGRSGGGTGGGGAPAGGGRGGRGAFGRIFGGMMQASKTLKITQADSILVIENEDGPVFINVKTDGKTLEEPMADQTVLKTKAQWRRTDLVVERSHDVNGSARMTFKLDPKNPKQMTVEFHYEHNRQRRTIDQKRIYDAGM